ncbi:HAD-IA family hydrolase [bacterium]|nr:HAD-IA family hydrolase [bacterium]
MKSKIAAVIFDMDGLMFNTEDLYNVVGDALLEPRGHKFTRELKLLMMGLPGKKAFQVMIDHCQLQDSISTLEAESAEMFADLLPREIRPMRGLMKLLDRLEHNDIPKAVATSSHQRFANIALSQFDLIPRFEFVLTAESVTNGKPHPDVYLLAAKRMGLQPSQLLVLEDSVTGSKAGVAAGANVIAIPTEHSAGMDYSHVDLMATSLEDPIIWQTIESSQADSDPAK